MSDFCCYAQKSKLFNIGIYPELQLAIQIGTNIVLMQHNNNRDQKYWEFVIEDCDS